MNNKNTKNDKAKSFRLSDEARALIDNEYSDVSDDYLNRMNTVGNPRIDVPIRRGMPKQKIKKRQPPPPPVQRYYPEERKGPAARYYPEEYDDAYIEPEEEHEEERPRKRKRKHRGKRLMIKLIALCLFIIAANIGVLFYTGQLWFNEPRKRDYPVRGPVITEKEGKVDWQRFSKQNIEMCYIRATKSTAYEDKNFQKNMKGSAKTSLPTGMLHEYDPSMGGKEQAEHFIEVCGDMDGRLRPAVEVEMNMLYKIIPPDYDKLSRELRAYADRIYEEYGCTPVIKCGKKVYSKIIADGDLDDCPIWYVSEYSKPDKDIRVDLWGYSSRVKFEYYESKGFLEMVLLYDGGELDDDMFI